MHSAKMLNFSEQSVRSAVLCVWFVFPQGLKPRASFSSWTPAPSVARLGHMRVIELKNGLLWSITSMFKFLNLITLYHKSGYKITFSKWHD